MRADSLLITLGLLGLAGCISAPAVTIAPSATRSNEPIVAGVREAQVTPQSAQKMCKVLDDELDRDAQQQLIGTAIQKR
jgi:hypothetical protein